MSDNIQDTTIDQCEQLVVFELAGEHYGVDIGDVNTIIRMQEITSIPGTSSYVNGVINLRGSIIPVIDLKQRFDLPTGEHTKASRIVVVEASGQMIGMIVDAVAETLRLPADSIEPPSPVISSVNSDYIRGVGKQDNRLVILLALDKVLAKQEFEKLSSIKEQEEVKKAA